MREMVEAKAPEKKRAKVLKSVEIRHAENGGHIVTHRFDNSGPGYGYHDSEDHAFGPEDGDKIVKHVADHMGLKISKAEAKVEKAEEKVSPGIHKKVETKLMNEAKGEK